MHGFAAVVVLMPVFKNLNVHERHVEMNQMTWKQSVTL